jgi:hypothetical protein
MKKILLVPSWYPSSGDPTAGVFIRKHALEISRHHQVTVLFFCYGKKEAGLWWKRVTTKCSVQLTEEQITIRDYGKWLNIFSMVILSNWLVLMKLIGRNRYDLINLNVVYHMGVILYPVLVLCNPTLIITEHWTGYFPEDGRYGKLGSWTRSTISKVFRKARKIIVISGSLKQQLADLFDVAHKTEIVSNFLNIPDAPRPLPLLIEDRVEILTISYMDDRMKGISGLIDAIEMVSEVMAVVQTLND